MIIKKIHIKNYKNLKNVTLDDLGQLNILIGPNGSGKTNLLEFLWNFSQGFTTTGGGPSLSEEYWWKHVPEEPIEISLKLELEKYEERKFPKEFLRIVKSPITIFIQRELKEPRTTWVTKLLEINNLKLIVDNKNLDLSEVNRQIRKEIKEIAKAYLFDPKASSQNLIGDRLVVIEGKAYFSDSEIDKLIKEGIIPYETIPPLPPKPPEQPEPRPRNYEEWCKEQGLELIKEPPPKDKLKDHLPLISQDKLVSTLSVIQNLIREMFIYLPATRNVPLRPGERKIIVGDDLAKTQFLLQPGTRESYQKFRYVKNKFRNSYEKIREELGDMYSPPIKDIQPISDEVKVDDSSAGGVVSIATQGGGEQELLNLIVKVASADRGKIIVVEEPEMHLHPKLCKVAFNVIKERTNENQIIVVTHSTEFIYRGKEQSISNFNFRVKEDGSIEVVKVMGEEIINVYRNLGVSPESGGAPNKILIVEGPSDRRFVEGIAEKSKARVLNFLVTLGANNYKFVEGLANRMKATLMELYLMIDSNNKDKNKYKELVTQGILKKIFTVDPDLEDIYPKSLLFKVLKNKPFGLDDESLKILQDGQIRQSKALEKLLKPTYGDEWKVVLASAITQSMNIEEIQRQETEEHEKIVEVIKFIQEVAS